VRVRGESLAGAVPRRRCQRGLAFLTENRREEGLCLGAAIAENLALVSLRQHARSPLRLLDFAGLGRAIRAIRQAVRLTPAARDDAPVGILSGGNQQKVVLAKWLLAKPGVLILDEPTRGIDVGAKFEIYQLIHELADQGAGVLLISSELEELLGLCDRLLVMSHGEIRDELTRAEFQRERILAAALGGPA
jgi:ribose transport system ATP-binding protein